MPESKISKIARTVIGLPFIILINSIFVLTAFVWYIIMIPVYFVNDGNLKNFNEDSPHNDWPVLSPYQFYKRIWK